MLPTHYWLRHLFEASHFQALRIQRKMIPMATILAFVRAVSRHWLLLFTGPLLSLALGGVEHYSGTSISFRIYVLVSGATILAAMYKAWRDEYLARQDADAKNELNRPAVVVSLNEGDRQGNTPPFSFSNMGATPAFNARMADIEIGDRLLEVTEIAEIAVGHSASPQASVRRSGLFFARDFVHFFKRAYETIGRQQWPNAADDDEWLNDKDQAYAAFGLGELVVPISVAYRDLNGIAYVTQHNLIFEPIANRLSIRFVYSGRAVSAPELKSPHIVAGTRDERRKLRT